MSPGYFKEPNEEQKAAFLAEIVGEDLSRADLIEAMEKLLVFVSESTYQWENNYYALVYATMARSARTFEGICTLLRSCLPVQAAMLTRSLFEDVIVAHWLVFNENDQEWLVERFLRHREAIALHQEKTQKETKFSMGTPIPVPDGLKEREAALVDEFGKQATRDWWDPGREGQGLGKDVGLRKLVTRLEKMAAEKVIFYPRFAGGEEPLLDRMDRVIHKWLSQCVHHTVAGLPFAPSGEEEAEQSSDQTLIVGFSASWLFAQQVYLMFELNHLSYEHIDTVWYYCLAMFTTIILGPDAADRLLQQWEDKYGSGAEGS
jgi:hypothetical protein